MDSLSIFKISKLALQAQQTCEKWATTCRLLHWQIRPREKKGEEGLHRNLSYALLLP